MEKQSLYSRICNIGLTDIISGLDRHGSFWSSEHICSAIDNKDFALMSYMDAIDHCGALDILTALCVIVDTECTEETRIWFFRLINRCKWADCIKHQFEYIKKWIQDTFSLFPSRLLRSRNRLLPVGYPMFEQIFWSNMDRQILNRIKKTDFANIGIWFPGLFQAEPDELYYQKLDNYAFPFLCSAGEDVVNSIDENETEKALIRMRMTDYLGELAALHYPKLGGALKTVLDEDPDVLANQDYQGFYLYIKNIVLAEENKHFYITPSFVFSLKKMLRLVQYYNDGRFSFAPEVRFFFPLFCEMTGMDNEAYELLVDQNNTGHPGRRVQNEYLLALYRALLITSDKNKRYRLTSSFDEYYFSNSSIKSFANLAEDIAQFYKAHSERIRNAYFSFDDPVFTELFKDSCISDQQYVINNWIRSGLIADTFSALVEDIKRLTLSSSIQLADQKDPISTFIILFSGLISHSDSTIRIFTPEIKKRLDPTAPDFTDSEIYGIYTSEEQRLLIAFEKRLVMIQPYLPTAFKIRQYQLIKENAARHWKTDPESVLCVRISSALRGIQSNYFTRKKTEDEQNNELAFYLRATYGESNVHREEPQGTSSSGKSKGETDLLIYLDGYQFALIESLRLSSVDTTQLDDHLERLLKKYNTQGVKQTALVIYAENVNETHFFDDIEQYLRKFQHPYPLLSLIKREPEKTAKLCHHRVTYSIEGYTRSLHVSTVLLQTK